MENLETTTKFSRLKSIQARIQHLKEVSQID